MFSMAIMTQNKSADTTSRSNCGHTTSSIMGKVTQNVFINSLYSQKQTFFPSLPSKDWSDILIVITFNDNWYNVNIFQLWKNYICLAAILSSCSYYTGLSHEV